MMSKHFLLVVVLALLSGCGSTPNPCGAGTVVEHEGRPYCVYRADAITEEGFRCPDAFRFEFPFDGFSACAAEGAQPPATFEEFIRMALDIAVRDGGIDADADADAATDAAGAIDDEDVRRRMRAAAAETEDESALSGFEGQNFCLGNCDMLTGDIRNFCNSDCARINNPDLRNYCNGDCDEISDGLLRGYCSGDCSTVSNGSDVRPLCEGDCTAIRRQSLRDFCLGNCSAL